MSPERFCDWLQGFVEISETEAISEKQWLVIKDHLKLVFDKKTPDRSEPLKIKSIDEVLKDMYKQYPSDSGYWKLGDPPLMAIC